MRKLLLFLSMILVSTWASANEVGDLVRDNKGNLISLEFRYALNYCKSKNSSLPTPHEIALFAIQRGARGIAETNYPDLDINNQLVKDEIAEMWVTVLGDDSLVNGYIPILKNISSETAAVDFYYDYRGYKGAIGEPAEINVWTLPVITGYKYNFAYIFNNNTGIFYKVYPHLYYKNYFRCTKP